MGNNEKLLAGSCNGKVRALSSVAVCRMMARKNLILQF